MIFPSNAAEPEPDRRHQACFVGWTYSTASLTPSPGYYVHTWNITLRQTVQMGYVSSPPVVRIQSGFPQAA